MIKKKDLFNKVKGKPSLSFYTNIPTPYQLSFFEELSKLSNLTVIYYSHTEGDREWNFALNAEYKIILLKNNIVARFMQKRIFDFHFSWKIFSTAWRDDSEFVIVGGSYWIPNASIALMFNRLKGKKICYFSEPLFETHSNIKYYLKWVYLRLLDLTCNAVLCIGRKAVESFTEYGIRAPKFIIPYNINVNKFKNLDSTRRRTFIEKYKKNGEFIILTSGSLIYRKGIDILIKAVRQIENRKLIFLILGNGPEKESLSLLSGTDARIIYAGFQEPDDIPYFFSMADIFAFASRYDGWAVVINEAIAANLPLICSDKVGAAIELITSNENGILCESENVTEFKIAMETLMNDEGKRNTIKKNTKNLIPFVSSECNAKLVYDIFTNKL